MWQEYPASAEYLLCRTWDGLLPREIPRCSLTATPTGWSFTLSMYTEGLKGTVQFRHLGDLMPALEAWLTQADPPWVELDVGTGAVKRRSERQKIIDARKQNAYSGKRRGKERGDESDPT